MCVGGGGGSCALNCFSMNLAIYRHRKILTHPVRLERLTKSQAVTVKCIAPLLVQTILFKETNYCSFTLKLHKCLVLSFPTLRSYQK